MQTIILAAGGGTRMRPLSDTSPKSMLPVADRPLVAHAAAVAVDAGADELVVVCHPDHEVVRSYFGEEFAGVPVSFVEQRARDTVVDSIRVAASKLDSSFAVLDGSALYGRESLRELFTAAPSVGVRSADDPASHVGACVLPAETVEWLDGLADGREERDATAVLSRTVERADVTTVEFRRWLGVDRPWELLEANEWKLGELERDVRGDVHPSAVLDGRVVVENGATVGAGTVIEGPVLVRSGATVGPNAYVRGATLVDEGARVGTCVEVKNSVLMPGATVPHLSYVGDSVLGRDVNFGAGTKVANLRHDGEAVRVTVENERVSTGRRKFGVVCGDGVKTGINASLDAGVTLAPGATALLGEVVTRDR